MTQTQDYLTVITPFSLMTPALLDEVKRTAQLAIDRTWAEDEPHRIALHVRDLVNQELELRRRADFEATLGLAQ